MKTKILSIILLGASSGLGLCSDYPDMTPTDRASDRLVWSKLDYAEQVINDLYRYIDYLGAYRDGQCLTGMTKALTDQSKHGSYNYMAKCQIPDEIAYGGFVLTVNYVSTYLGNWGTMYEYVRRVSEGINKLKKYASFGQADEERSEAEVRFFRGCLYIDLLRRYKEVTIYDENLDNMKKDMPASSEADGWNFVYNDLKYVDEYLLVDRTPNGCPASGAAYAMLSKAISHAERWDDARIVAEKMTGMDYELEAKEDCSNTFKVGSKEATLQYCHDKSSTVTHDFDGYVVPGGDKALDGSSMTGGSGIPIQKMVESYEYVGGSGFPDWSVWHTAEGTTTTPPYAELESRFRVTILYNGATWKGRPIEPSINSTDGWTAWKTDAKLEGRSTTGYYLRKLVDEAHNFTSIQANTQPWIEIRYAEVLLNHAEAYYHLNGYTDKTDKGIKDIRDRVGLSYTDKSGDDLVKAIRQECRVGLAYEGHYRWDMRRQKLSATASTGIRLHGMKIERNANGSFIYIYTECDDKGRNFPTKMYRFLMPQAGLDNNGAVTRYAE